MQLQVQGTGWKVCMTLPSWTTFTMQTLHYLALFNLLFSAIFILPVCTLLLKQTSSACLNLLESSGSDLITFSFWLSEFGRKMPLVNRLKLLLFYLKLMCLYYIALIPSIWLPCSIFNITLRCASHFWIPVLPFVPPLSSSVSVCLSVVYPVHLVDFFALYNEKLCGPFENTGGIGKR